MGVFAQYSDWTVYTLFEVKQRQGTEIPNEQQQLFTYFNVMFLNFVNQW